MHKFIIAMFTIFNFQNCNIGQNVKVIDLSIFQSGDLLFRFGNGFFSKYFRDFSDHDKVYSHVGIINIENDSVFVIHSEASEDTGIGGVISESIYKYLNDGSIYGLYRFSDSLAIRKNIAKEAVHYLKRRIPFDTKFNFQDTTSFYCTELIAHCINKTAGCDLILPNKYLTSYSVITIDHIYYNNQFLSKINF